MIANKPENLRKWLVNQQQVSLFMNDPRLPRPPCRVKTRWRRAIDAKAMPNRVALIYRVNGRGIKNLAAILIKTTYFLVKSSVTVIEALEPQVITISLRKEKFAQGNVGNIHEIVKTKNQLGTLFASQSKRLGQACQYRTLPACDVSLTEKGAR